MEERFVEQIHLSAYDQRAYWISGRSDRAPGECCLSGYGLPDDGKAPLIRNLVFFSSGFPSPDDDKALTSVNYCMNIS